MDHLLLLTLHSIHPQPLLLPLLSQVIVSKPAEAIVPITSEVVVSELPEAIVGLAHELRGLFQTPPRQMVLRQTESHRQRSVKEAS